MDGVPNCQPNKTVFRIQDTANSPWRFLVHIVPSRLTDGFAQSAIASPLGWTPQSRLANTLPAWLAKGTKPPGRRIHLTFALWDSEC